LVGQVSKPARLISRGLLICRTAYAAWPGCTARRTAQMKRPMSDPNDKRDQTRARLVAAGALALTAVMAFVLVMTTPRGEASQATPEHVWPTALAQPNLRGFLASPDVCEQVLIDAHIQIAEAPDMKEGGSCGYEHAVSLTQSLHPYSQPVTTS